MQGKRYTFRLSIDEGDMPVVDALVGANEDEGEVARAKKAIQRLLADFTPRFQKPEPPSVAPESDLEAQETIAPTAPPEPELPSAPPSEPEPEGVRGLIHMRCAGCGKMLATFLNQKKSEVTCRCGYVIDLTKPLAKFKYTCPYCKTERWGLTNLEDAAISVKCKCGCIVDLQWDPKAKEYRN